eukprot:1948698-Rhodomonas_salina.1
MGKVNAECAMWAHCGSNCGNKRIQRFLQNGAASPVFLDLFPGMGLGLRAIRNIVAGEILGVYWGR